MNSPADNPPPADPKPPADAKLPAASPATLADVDFVECQFDSLVGPTHNYAGLAYGNVASQRHRAQTAHPRLGARQGLDKMWQVARMGIPQAVLPPLPRPRLDWLRGLGFHGSDANVIAAAHATAPQLLAAAYSASAMWAANAATVSPSLDTADQRVHLTPANLASSLHRSIEADQVTANLRSLFATPDFHVHDPLPSAVPLTDEGAANHTRLAPDFHSPGLEVFVYGRNALDASQPQPTKFPARQTLHASQAIARRHGLDPARTFFVQQAPAAIDAGVFHNDVISVGHQNLLLVHQDAFVDQPRVLAELQDRFQQLYGQKLNVLQIPTQALSLPDAVASYLFNSQILTTAAGDHVLLCPQDCQNNPAAQAVLAGLLAGDFSHGQRHLAAAHFLDLRQSMNNGGGPACLRLRVLLNRQQRAAVRGRVWLDESLYHDLCQWVERTYPETLAPEDLANPQLARQATAALDELKDILAWPA